jgi:hypothetical protein
MGNDPLKLQTPLAGSRPVEKPSGAPGVPSRGGIRHAP